MNRSKFPFLLAGWLVLCVFLNCTGWTLSAFHALNRMGYLVVIILGGVLVCFWRRRNHDGGCLAAASGWRWQPRFRRWFPRAFLLLAVLSFVGGVIHLPTNYDGLSYRTPRVLCWLAEGQWHWIHTAFGRLNVRGCGYEWLTAPLLAFTRTDRFLFLINFISLLLLPGLIFSLFTRLGVGARAAWHWMWLLPGSYCVLLQAGGIANDMFNIVFALAAVDFALRARVTRLPRDLWLSCLAAALLSGAKFSNLPLLLPWAIALAPSLNLLKGRMAPALGIGLAALGASLVPMAALNVKYCGDWSGMALEKGLHTQDSPAIHVAGNAAQLVLENLVPPVFPLAGKWNEAAPRLMPEKIRTAMEAAFETPAAHLRLPELQVEENAGLGFGVSLLVIATVVAAWFRRGKSGESRLAAGGLLLFLVRWSGYISLLAFMLKSGLSEAARLATPYYFILLPSLLAGGQAAAVVRRRWWRLSAQFACIIAGGLVLASPDRPLLPVRSVLHALNSSARPLLQRVDSVYAVYSLRADGFAPLRNALPPDAMMVGLIQLNEPETSLWRPFGHRRFRHVLPGDSGADLRRAGIEYLLVNASAYPVQFQAEGFNLPYDRWLGEINGEEVARIPLTLKVSTGPVDWSVVRLRAGPGSSIQR